ncbi:MAG: DUF1206 domain-containing protein [Leptolyngbyaceae cyanobacterium SM2_3_12]|nr:DUF1206 domain-containing protein [Leptolyngbyaceae cyanobacterium SM2_3_12]
MNLSRLWNFRAGLTRLLANPWMRQWFRLGHGAKGFLYGLVGLFILKNLRFEDQQVGGTDLVISTLDNRLFGNIILIFLALGLLGYSLWRLIQAGLDPAHSGDKNLRHVAQRIGYGISCLTYLGVAYSATRLGIGLAVDFDDSVEDLASFFFEYTFGPWLLLAVSAGVFLVGCLYIYGAIPKVLSATFNLSLMTQLRRELSSLAR